jgi:hypothetical protein
MHCMVLLVVLLSYFFPGNYDGNMFETLNVIEPDPYYRAFRLVPEKTSAELKTSNI